MYKKAIFVVICLCFIFSYRTTYAQENNTSIVQENKTSILVLLTGSLNKFKSWDKDVYKETTENFQKTFSPNYNLLIGEQFNKKLSDTGMSDVGSMERSDIINAYKDISPNYIIVYDFLPSQTSGFWLMPNWTSFVHLKIIDVQGNNYVYSGKFSFDSALGSVTGDLKHIYLDIEKQVFFKKFPLITPNEKNK